MQHIDSSGYMLWDRQGKPLCVKPGYQFSPFLIADGEGGFVVVWHDYRNSLEDWRYDRDVYAQRIDKYGNKLWGEDDLLICKELYYQGVSGITMTSDSCFIIVWDDDRDYPDGDGSIYVQKVDKMGNLLWDSRGIKVAENWGQITRIVSDMNGGCLIIFQNLNDKKLYLQHVNRKGEKRLGNRGKVIGYDSGGDADLYIQACSDKRGGAIVSWGKHWAGDQAEAYIQRVDSSGNRLWGESEIYLSNNSIKSYNPTTMMLGEDSVVCITELGGQTRLYLQIFDLNGHKKFTGAGKKITNFWGLSKLYFGISFDIYEKKYIYISVQKHESGDAPCVLKTDSNGKLYWDSSGVVISNYKISVFQKVFISVDDKGNAIIVWEDDRKTEYFPDIYAQKIYVNGKIAGDTSTSIKDTFPLKKSYQLYSRIYPNPFNHSLTIEFKVPDKGEVKIEIYNIAGQNIRNFIRQGTANQWQRIIWDGKTTQGLSVSSGLYFVQISFKNHHLFKKALFIK